MQALGLQFLSCCVLDVDCYTSVLGVLLGQEVGRLLGAAVYQMVQGRGCSTCLVLASHKERRALWCVHAGSAAMIKVHSHLSWHAHCTHCLIGSGPLLDLLGVVTEGSVGAVTQHPAALRQINKLAAGASSMAISTTAQSQCWVELVLGARATVQKQQTLGASKQLIKSYAGQCVLTKPENARPTQAIPWSQPGGVGNLSRVARQSSNAANHLHLLYTTSKLQLLQCKVALI
jgi:hypothetical protein